MSEATVTVMMPAVSSVLRVSGSVKFGSGQLSMTSCGGSKPPGIMVIVVVVVVLSKGFFAKIDSKYHTRDWSWTSIIYLNCKN